MIDIHALAQPFKSWNSLYSHSKVISTTVTTMHVLIGIVVLFITGIAMTLADLENFLPSPVFWTKIGLVTLLLINGTLLQRTESTLRRAAETGPATDTTTAAAPGQWQQIRRFSVFSVVLWTATFLAGSILTNAS